MRITVYLTGGIAIYKAIEVVRNLEKQGYEVRVVMTNNAEKLVSSNTLAALTKHAVLDDLWRHEVADRIPHIELARWTELAVVVPATANFIAKMANGIADDAASTTILASSCPKMIVPAMNDQMLENPATQRNLNFLKENGVKILEPVVGELAEGYVAKGRMPEPAQITDWILNSIDSNQYLRGKKVIVTAGGTREKIDPVRYIGNFSSGKMGIAFAEEAAKAGAEVTLIYAAVNVTLPHSSRIKLIHVDSSEEMENAVLEQFKRADVLIMAAAVADWRVEKIAKNKLKKTAQQDDLTLKLIKTPDILLEAAKIKEEKQLVIGFAAETENLLANAKKKLEAKGADYLIANNVSADRFGSDKDQVTILGKNAFNVKLPRMNKQKVAKKALTLIFCNCNKNVI